MSNQTRTHLLLVDSSASALAKLRSDLHENGYVQKIVTADAGESAIHLIKEAPPHVVLADMRLNDMSGIRLLLQVKGMYPQILTIMTSDCGSDEARNMCHEAGIDCFMEKPVDVDVLVEQMSALETQEESFFRGRLEDLKIPDVLQLVTSRPVPMLIRIDSPHGEGCIEIEDGQVIHARSNGRVGEEAFYEMAAWNTGCFEVVNVLCPEERTITASLNHLLINSARHQETEDQEPLTGAVDTFLPENESAPEVSHLWAPMSHYASPRVRQRVTQRSSAPNPAGSPSGKEARRPAAVESAQTKLRFKPRAPAPPPSPVAEPIQRVAPPDASAPRRSWRARTLHVALASAAAVVVLAAGIRYTDVLDISYGRNMVPFLDEVTRNLFFAGEETDPSVVEASAAFDLTRATLVGDEDVARQLAQRSGMAYLGDGSRPSYRIGFSRSEALREGSNRVGVDEALFDRLALDKNPWVELMGPSGITIGAFAVRMRTGVSPVLITGLMAEVLLNQGGTLTHVQMVPVAWAKAPSKTGRGFSSIRRLPEAYRDHWFAVGLSLEAMQSMGLTPGAYAEVGGPEGSQSVRVQLVDQGRPDEIWMSESVQDSIGAQEGYASVKLRPKS